MPPSDGVLFDGDMEYASMALEPEFRDVAGFTVAAWVKLERASGIQTLMNRGERGDLFTLYLYNDHVRMLVEYQPDQYTYALTEPPPAGTWIHYAGSYDGETIRLYVNGSEVDSAAAPGRMPVREDPLFVGATSPYLNAVGGLLSDVRFYAAALSPLEIEAVFAGGHPPIDAPSLCFTDAELEAQIRTDFPQVEDGEEPVYPFANGTLATTDGFRGLWYLNGRSDDGLHKYSGGLGTYPQQHIPIAIYAEEANKTFFTYGGTRKDQNRLLHMVSAYDHETGKVARPRILLDKMTNDAHDNPTISIDSDGYIWIFSNAHGTGRPSYIHRSAKPYCVEAFHRQVRTNFSYSQPWHIEEHGFVFLHTLYSQGRRLFVANSDDGKVWSDPRPLAYIRNGHYQISWPRGSTIGTAFNYHPDGASPLGRGLDYRTNLYYMESGDGGQTWQNVRGEALNLPLNQIANPALAVEYESQLKIVYLKDIQYTAEGHPVILHLTSPGWESGPNNDPRTFATAHWTGSEWRVRPVTTSDNNYDFASLYIEPDGLWRIIGTTETGPQPYNTGGEMAMWISRDEGESWVVKQLTENSEYNHTYPRRPLHAHPDFYAFWADGDGREISPSRFYFTNRDGDVFRLPYEIKSDDRWIDPEPIASPPTETVLRGSGPRTVFDSGGFENDDLYPEGDLRAVAHGGSSWQPGGDPAAVAIVEPPQNKVLRRVRGSGNFNREWLHFPPASEEILIVELDVKVSDPDVRTLDLSVMPETGGLQASLLGWGTTPGFLDYYDGSAWVSLMELDGSWRRFRIIHYLAGPYRNRFDLIADDALIGEKLRFRHEFELGDRLSRLRVNASGPSGERVEIDNLRILAQSMTGVNFLPAATIREIGRGDGGFSVSFSTLPGFDYAFEVTGRLGETAWTPLETVSGSGGVRVMTDPASGKNRQFYRVRTIGLNP